MQAASIWAAYDVEYCEELTAIVLSQLQHDWRDMVLKVQEEGKSCYSLLLAILNLSLEPLGELHAQTLKASNALREFEINCTNLITC